MENWGPSVWGLGIKVSVIDVGTGMVRVDGCYCGINMIWMKGKNDSTGAVMLGD